MRRDRKELPEHIAKYVEPFSAELERQDKSKLTVANYGNDVELFALWLEESYGDRFDPSRVVQRDIVEYRSHLTTIRNAGPATVNRRLASLSAFFKWCMAEGYAGTNPADNVKQTHIVDSGPRSIDTTSLRRLLREAHVHANTRDTAIVELLCHTGLRVGELVAMQLGDIEISERKGVAVVRQGKRRTSRQVPLNVDVRKALQAYLQVRPTTTSRFLFIGQRGIKMTTSGVWRIVKRYATLAGVPELRVHDLRHTALTRLVREFGLDLATVAKISGHRNLKTLLRYAEPTQDDLAAAVERLAFTDG